MGMLRLFAINIFENVYEIRCPYARSESGGACFEYFKPVFDT